MSLNQQKTNNITYKLFLSEKNFILSLINKTRIIYSSKLTKKNIYTSNSSHVRYPKIWSNKLRPPTNTAFSNRQKLKIEQHD